MANGGGADGRGRTAGAQGPNDEAGTGARGGDGRRRDGRNGEHGDRDSRAATRRGRGLRVGNATTRAGLDGDPPENGTTVATLVATDADTLAANLAWSIAGGADADKFTLTAAGALAFKAAPDFEAPDDAGADGER